VTHRHAEGIARYFDFAVGRHPADELYDLSNDPHQMNNVAADPDFEDSRKRLSQRLMKILKSTGDPRVTGDGSTFDKPPFAP